MLQLRWDDRLAVGLLLEYERGEERDDFLGVIGGEGVFKNELREYELISGVDLKKSGGVGRCKRKMRTWYMRRR